MYILKLRAAVLSEIHASVCVLNTDHFEFSKTTIEIVTKGNPNNLPN